MQKEDDTLFVIDCPSWVDLFEEAYKQSETDVHWFARPQPQLRTPLSVIQYEEQQRRGRETPAETPSVKHRKRGKKHSISSTSKKLSYNSSSDDEIMEMLRQHNQKIQQKAGYKTLGANNYCKKNNSTTSTSHNQVPSKTRKIQPRMSRSTHSSSEKCTQPDIDSPVEHSTNNTNNTNSDVDTGTKSASSSDDEISQMLRLHNQRIQQKLDGKSASSQERTTTPEVASRRCTNPSFNMHPVAGNANPNTHKVDGKVTSSQPGKVTSSQPGKTRKTMPRRSMAPQMAPQISARKLQINSPIENNKENLQNNLQSRDMTSLSQEISLKEKNFTVAESLASNSENVVINPVISPITCNPNQTPEIPAVPSTTKHPDPEPSRAQTQRKPVSCRRSAVAFGLLKSDKQKPVEKSDVDALSVKFAGTCVTKTGTKRRPPADAPTVVEKVTITSVGVKCSKRTDKTPPLPPARTGTSSAPLPPAKPGSSSAPLPPAKPGSSSAPFPPAKPGSSSAPFPPAKPGSSTTRGVKNRKSVVFPSRTSVPTKTATVSHRPNKDNTQKSTQQRSTLPSNKRTSTLPSNKQKPAQPPNKQKPTQPSNKQKPSLQPNKTHQSTVRKRVPNKPSDIFTVDSTILAVINAKTPMSKQKCSKTLLQKPPVPVPEEDDLDTFIMEKLRAHNAKIQAKHVSNNRIPGSVTRTARNVSLHVRSPCKPKIKPSVGKK